MIRYYSNVILRALNVVRTNEITLDPEVIPRLVDIFC